MKQDLGLTRRGRPRKIVARPQEGNAAWKAAAAAARIPKGGIGHRTCARAEPCHALAIRGSPLCRWHTNLPLRRWSKEAINNRRLRYAQWTISKWQKQYQDTYEGPSQAIDRKEEIGAAYTTGRDM